jgi:hypothetical protein
MVSLMSHQISHRSLVPNSLSEQNLKMQKCTWVLSRKIVNLSCQPLLGKFQVNISSSPQLQQFYDKNWPEMHLKPPCPAAVIGLPPLLSKGQYRASISVCATSSTSAMSLQTMPAQSTLNPKPPNLGRPEIVRFMAFPGLHYTTCRPPEC